MDPNETLRLARKALAEGRAREAAEHYAHLAYMLYGQDGE